MYISNIALHISLDTFFSKVDTLWNKAHFLGGAERRKDNVFVCSPDCGGVEQFYDMFKWISLLCLDIYLSSEVKRQTIFVYLKSLICFNCTNIKENEF